MENTSAMPGNENDKVIIKNLTEEKNNLLKIISHDIRAPFNQMFALLQMFEMEFNNISDNQQEYINRMYRAVLGGMEMIKNLHDARSLDNGNITLNPEHFSLRKQIQNSVRNFTIQCRIKDAKIQFDESDPDVEINSDRILLGKVFDIILSNALKYSVPGSQVKVRLSTSESRSVVSFKDQGPGLSEEERKLIFSKFRKLTPKPTMDEATTGLGMFLALEFSKMLKIDIRVENDPEGGLLVKVTME
jgi:signal transduction histidine kinase